MTHCGNWDSLQSGFKSPIRHDVPAIEQAQPRGMKRNAVHAVGRRGIESTDSTGILNVGQVMNNETEHSPGAIAESAAVFHAFRHVQRQMGHGVRKPVERRIFQILERVNGVFHGERVIGNFFYAPAFQLFSISSIEPLRQACPHVVRARASATLPSH